ncbi:N-acetylmuramoyl-L-alanine amidase [Clostridium algidicarnis]|uniref:N-acetylmuramoyl-L-alanine amidase n=1 Tax=Clostridium algidicarnis TaxID=37659 RepID=UPI003FD730AF
MVDVLGLRGGHSPYCVGAIGHLHEQQQMLNYYHAIKEVWEGYGHTIVDCNSNASSEGGELSEGASRANSTNIDLFVSLHMNSFNGNAYGTEAWTYGSGSRANPYAQNLVNNFKELGFTNRGVKYNKNYYEMQNINAPNIIFETCFCDNVSDAALYNKLSWKQLAHAFCNALDSNIPFTPPAPIVPPTKPTEEVESDVFYRVVVGSYKNKDSAVSIMNEAKIKGFNDAFLVAFTE